MRGDMPRAVVNRCYRWLRPAEPSPPCSMTVDSVRLNPADSHALWREQVQHQRRWPYPWDLDFDQKCEGSVKRSLGRAWTHRGEGWADHQVEAEEVGIVTQHWDPSSATTADLIPRCVLKMWHGSWYRLVFGLKTPTLAV